MLDDTNLIAAIVEEAAIEYRDDTRNRAVKLEHFGEILWILI